MISKTAINDSKDDEVLEFINLYYVWQTGLILLIVPNVPNRSQI